MRRPEIGLAITDDRQCPIGQISVQPPITGTPTLARSQSGGARLTVTIHQTLELTHGHAQSFGRASGLQARVHHGLDYLESIKLSHRQCHQSGWLHGRPPCLLNEPSSMPAVKNTTSVNSQNTTLGYSCYNKCRGHFKMSWRQLNRNVRF
ncbi:hypothetical protein BURCE16_21195 [Burkholderia cepacia]|nr:hypothetical protein BURCE16_21195 [Burkholderia cepacia]